MEPVRIRVATDAPYDVVVGADILRDVGTLVRDVSDARRVALVSDTRVAELFGVHVGASLVGAGFDVSELSVEPGEASKSWQVAGELLEAFANDGLGRRDLVVALGGGVIGDLAGFAAASYLRGVSFAQVPTTLLAQVDSSVGGKTGVDLRAGKNLAGAFKQPVVVVADVAAPTSLPAEEWASRVDLDASFTYGFDLQNRTLLFVPDGPYLVKGTPFTTKAFAIIFHSKELRSAAFGYFGHMWELYTFYAFIPFMLASYAAMHSGAMNISFWSFAIIAAGGIGCAGGGIISKRAGSARVAWVQLCCSGLLCVCSPLLFRLPAGVFLGVFIVWGIVVVGDSPQFSALIANYAPRELVGSALTIGNSIGFAITIVSIQAISSLSHVIAPEYIFTFLTIGPAAGLYWFRRLAFQAE